MGLMRRESAESNALRRMRFSVTLSCIFITGAFLIHILIWGFASFTDIRFVRSEIAAGQRNSAVVVRGSDSVENGSSGMQMKPTPVRGNPANNKLSSPLSADSPGSQPLDTHLEFSSADSLLRIIYQLSTALAWTGLVLLLLETTLAVVVAGGIRAPGISHVVHAQLWACLLIALAVPWSYFIASFPIPPLLSDYSAMTVLAEPFRVHDAQSTSPLIFFSRFLMMPLVILVVAGWISWLFHKGTAEVVEKAGPTDFEIEIEEETAGRKAGSVIYGGRARSALQQAVPRDDKIVDDISGSEDVRNASAEPLINKKKTLDSSSNSDVSVQPLDNAQEDCTDSAVASAESSSSQEEEPFRRPI